MRLWEDLESDMPQEGQEPPEGEKSEGRKRRKDDEDKHDKNAGPRRSKRLAQ